MFLTYPKLQLHQHSKWFRGNKYNEEAFNKRRLSAFDVFNNIDNIKIAKPNGAFYLFLI